MDIIFFPPFQMLCMSYEAIRWGTKGNGRFKKTWLEKNEVVTEFKMGSKKVKVR